jgi:hypothetical protein
VEKSKAMKTRHAGRQLVRQHGYAGSIALLKSGYFQSAPGCFDPEAEWLPSTAEGLNQVIFAAVLGHSHAKRAPKRSKKGQFELLIS